MEVAAKKEEKKDRWWIFELLLEAVELLIYIPRLVFRFIREIN